MFIAIGHDPATALFKEQLDMDKEGYLLTKPDSTETNIPGVYAAGDVKDKTFRQAVTASINTVLPVCANRPAKLIASVVFPTPPLLLASAIITFNSHTHQVLQDLHSIDDASRIALGRLQAQL